ncbi:MAG: tetratricopeptide repeat protein [Cyanobacteria bacterium P01_A01_bin.135]
MHCLISWLNLRRLNRWGGRGVTWILPGVLMLAAPAAQVAEAAVQQSPEERHAEANRLLQQGKAQLNAGQFQAALEHFLPALEIYQEVGDLRSQGITLGDLGLVYHNLGQHQQAIQLYALAIAIAREIGNQRNEGAVLGNLGHAYEALGQHQQAIALYEQQLAIVREVGHRRGESYALGNLGIAYGNLGENQQAIDAYRQALAIAQEIGDRPGEGALLSNIGALLAEENQPEQAIAALQQSVAVREAIRRDLRDLSPAQQQAFLDSVSDTYLALAALLEQEGQDEEAQRILNLLSER